MDLAEVPITVAQHSALQSALAETVLGCLCIDDSNEHYADYLAIFNQWKPLVEFPSTDPDHLRRAECLERLGAKLAQIQDEDPEGELAMRIIEEELQMFCLKSMCCRRNAEVAHPNLTTVPRVDSGKSQSLTAGSQIKRIEDERLPVVDECVKEE